MDKTRLDALERLWPGEGPAPRPPSVEGVGAPPGYRPPPSRAEIRADETTRIAREIVEAEAEKRRANIARLEKARHEREATQAALAPAEAPRKARRRS